MKWMQFKYRVEQWVECYWFEALSYAALWMVAFIAGVTTYHYFKGCI